MSSGPFAATQPVDPAGSFGSPRRPVRDRRASVVVRAARSALVLTLLATVLTVTVLTASLTAVVAVVSAPWWAYRLWLAPLLDRSPSGPGTLPPASAGRDEQRAVVAPSGT
ncbi:hypothetical protein ACFP63_13595 [Oerskovia jenensis]|uniref:Uncharacterized protein n=1 Tax=Oerskovia jenensis TaxID=162169 RepID=A0ABS2LAC8_9CELL|nr:hypothetical protein [Oerskovia jenensis]MBM7477342.1 hypothetical protein [Oerskovia jenensis]